MPDVIITVSYGNGNLVVNPNVQTIPNPSTIVWQAQGQVDRIESITFNDKSGTRWPYGTPAEVPGSNGKKFSVVDQNTETETTTYSYGVTALVNNESKTLDPEIVNEGHPRL